MLLLALARLEEPFSLQPSVWVEVRVRARLQLLQCVVCFAPEPPFPTFSLVFLLQREEEKWVESEKGKGPTFQALLHGLSLAFSTTKLL